MSYKPDDEIYSNSEAEFTDSTEEKQEETANDNIMEFDEPYDDTKDMKPEPVKKSNPKGFIYDLIFYAVLIFVCIYILPNFVLQRTIVDGASMENTLHDGEQLYVEKLSYHFDALKRFDIIVFYPYGRENEEYYVKRIIGLPGETVQIIGSNIYIDGKKLEEHYGKEPIMDPGRAEDPIKLGDDEYFVLGDNRNISKDSRYDDVGNVKKENIGGRVIFRIKPLSKFGLVN
ncbi:MAG TPA: signal peptidase I [Mobilitalea sp.]|nr:signal peptidase I [Mobilitalea sp.]